MTVFVRDFLTFIQFGKDFLYIKTDMWIWLGNNYSRINDRGYAL